MHRISIAMHCGSGFQCIRHCSAFKIQTDIEGRIKVEKTFKFKESLLVCNNTISPG